MSISEYLVLFKKTKNVKYLAFAVLLIIRQGRLTEVCWSVLCVLLYRPSPISEFEENKEVIERSIDAAQHYYPGYLSREDLIQTYGETFSLDGLPADFLGVRSESIVITDAWIILGEYAEKSARLVHAGKKHFRMYGYYNTVSGVRHIHSIHLSSCSTYVFVSTGDGKKYLDKWTVSNNKMKFSYRLRNRLGGYTAATSVAGKTYFGTDFSSRPNYLETIYGEKFPFPLPAFKMYVEVLGALDDRYVISLNSAHALVDKAKALSIFDTKHQTYVYSDFFKFRPDSSGFDHEDTDS